MNENFNKFQSESAEIIASFSDAIAKISTAEPSKAKEVKHKLEASLANALCSLSASLATSVMSVGQASLTNSISEISSSTESSVEKISTDSESNVASLASSLADVNLGSFANNVLKLRGQLKAKIERLIK